MKVHSTVLVAAFLAAVAPAGSALAQDSRAATAQPVVFTVEQLDNLVAPVALYPDAILAQVLIAATFPDQLEFAARYVKANGTKGIDGQNWDVSVKAVAHYPPLLNMLADRDDWTTALGQAYASQSSEVMESVQHLREMARAQGNLQSTSQQTVIEEDNNIRIVPAQPQVIYVPTYDPEIIYYRPAVYVGAYSGYWSFGVGFPIGAWLSYDFDWYGRRVYYDGWRGGGWRAVSYPYIFVNTVYIHPRYETVYYNRDVWRRPVNYNNFNRYNTVHRTVNWNERGRGPSSPGPIQRGVANNDGRRDDGRNNQGRNDGRSQTQGRDQTQTQGRNDPRGQNQGRDDGRNQNGARTPTQSQPTRNDPRTAHDRGTADRGNMDRGSVMARPPVVTDRAERTAPPQVERRSVPPVERRSAPPVERRSAPPVMEQRSAPPVERRSAPPMMERRSAPPSVERRSAPPSVERRSAPPAVERRSAPPSAQRQSAPPSRSSGSSKGSSSQGGDSRSRGSRGR